MYLPVSSMASYRKNLPRPEALVIKQASLPRSLRVPSLKKISAAERFTCAPGFFLAGTLADTAAEPGTNSKRTAARASFGARIRLKVALSKADGSRDFGQGGEYVLPACPDLRDFVFLIYFSGCCRRI